MPSAAKIYNFAPPFDTVSLHGRGIICLIEQSCEGGTRRWPIPPKAGNTIPGRPPAGTGTAGRPGSPCSCKARRPPSFLSGSPVCAPAQKRQVRRPQQQPTRRAPSGQPGPPPGSAAPPPTPRFSSALGAGGTDQLPDSGLHLRLVHTACPARRGGRFRRTERRGTCPCGSGSGRMRIPLRRRCAAAGRCRIP